MKTFPEQVKLRSHQSKALEKMSNKKILLGGVGSGKSLTGLAYYNRYEKSKDLYIITTALKRDSGEWSDDAMKMGIPQKDHGGPMVVDSWNNIEKYKDVRDAFFIFDEQRVVGTGKWAKTFLHISKKNHWILLTATPGDKWEDYTMVFVANGFFKNPTEYNREHMIYSYYGGYPKLVRYVGEPKLERLRREVLVEMDYVAHTRRHIEYVGVDYDKELYKETVKSRFNTIADRPYTNAAELLYGLRRLVNSDRSRIKKTKEIVKKTKRLIVFYNFNYELEMLREALGEYEVREWNGHRHDPLPSTDEWVYLVQYMAGAEGWNCITTDTILFFSMTYSYKQFDQSMGRIDRMNTPYFDLKYYVLESKSDIDLAIKKALSEKKDFNERAYIEGLDISAEKTH